MCNKIKPTVENVKKPLKKKDNDMTDGVNPEDIEFDFVNKPKRVFMQLEEEQTSHQIDTFSASQNAENHSQTIQNFERKLRSDFQGIRKVLFRE